MAATTRMRCAELITLDRLGAIAVVVDPTGRVVDCTHAFVGASRRSAAEICGRAVWELVDEPDVERLRRVIADVHSDGIRRNVDTSMIDGSGTRYAIAWSCSRRPDDDHQLIVLGVQRQDEASSTTEQADSERRRTEHALVERERELSAIYANVPGVLFYVSAEPDGEFRFASINQAFLEVTGLRREDVVGMLVRDVIPPPSRDMVLANYREAIRTRRTIRWEEVSTYPAGERIGEVAVTPLFDTAGAATGLIGIVHDITERKQAENALREADVRKTEFLAALSHELRNPLTPIRNSLAILTQEVAHGDRPRRALEILDRQIGHLVGLVGDLLDITRITQSRVELRCAVLDLGALVHGTVEDYRGSFEVGGLALALELPDPPVFVHGDATRLVQVVGNLLANSLKFTPRGGHVHVSLERDGDTVAMRVRDSGVGIDSDVLAQLFVPFAQGRQPLDRAAGGLGLGLALVKRLVEQHGGAVAVASDGPGAGTELTVRLPIVEGSAAIAPEVEVRDEIVRRILVIEDNVDAAETIQYLLESCGHQVQVAHDGPSGLIAARAFDPEIVFCDLGLPGMTGYDVCRALRAEGGSTRILAALSGYAQPCDREQSASAGFDVHVAKPPTQLDLQRVIALVSASSR